MAHQGKAARHIVRGMLRVRYKRLKRRLRVFSRGILWRIGRILAPFILKALRSLPRDKLHAIGTGFGSAWFHLIASSRGLGLDNLDRVFGKSVPRGQKEYFCRESFKNILKCMLDFYYFSFHPEEIESHILADPEAEERVRAILDKGRGALVFSAHIGNWELLASYMGRIAPINLLTRRHKDFNRYVRDCRARHHVDTIYDDSMTSMKKILRRLRQGEMVGLIIDRNLRHVGGMMVDFMGSPAFTPYYPVKLALKTGAPVIGIFLLREGPFYRLHIEDPIEVKMLDDIETTYRVYTHAFLKTVEKHIRTHPGQWFWAHKRWSRPKGTVTFPPQA